MTAPAVTAPPPTLGDARANAGALVLCYHAISADWGCPLAVKPSELARQVSLLLARGWTPATFSQALCAPPSARTFAVTFDDAFLSVLELALPLLAGLGVPATVFAPSAFMERRQLLSWPGIESWAAGADARELECMDWDDLARLAANDWEIGSHTASHRHLAGLSDAELEAELGGSRQALSDALGRPCTSLAYPYGYVDARALAAAERAGYRTAGTLSGAPAGAPATLLAYPRMGVYRVDALWRFRLKLSPVRRLARWGHSRMEVR